MYNNEQDEENYEQNNYSDNSSNKNKKTSGVKVFFLLLFALFLVIPAFYVGMFIGQRNNAFTEVLNYLETYHFSQPTEEELLEGAIDGMIDSLDDPYTKYFDYTDYMLYTSSSDESYVGVGMQLTISDDRFIVSSVTIGSPAEKAGLLVNDILTEIDGTSTEGLDFYSVSNLVSGDVDEVVTFKVLRGSTVITFDITRAIINTPSVTSTIYDYEGNKYGYLAINTFGAETDTLFNTELTNLEENTFDYLVIDVRNNGGGSLTTLVNILNNFLLDDGREMFSTVTFNNGVTTQDKYFGKATSKKTYDIAVLINEGSASASEVFASAMNQQGGYPLIGEKTFGKGTMQTDVDINSSEGDSLHISIGKWYTSDGSWVHYDGGTDGFSPTEEISLDSMFSVYKFFSTTDLTLDTVSANNMNLQIFLNSYKDTYDIREDGYFDLSTQNALIDFQVEMGIIESGIVDDNTKMYINAYIDNYRDLSSDDINFKNDNQLVGTFDYLVEVR